MSDEFSPYREFGLFTLIIAEVVVSPTLLGGLTYWMLRHSSVQMVFTPIAALAGLVFAFYRISQLRKRKEKRES
jgi:hypothetical protein